MLPTGQSAGPVTTATGTSRKSVIPVPVPQSSQQIISPAASEGGRPHTVDGGKDRYFKYFKYLQ